MKDMQEGPDLGLRTTRDGGRTLLLPKVAPDQHQSLQGTMESDGENNASTPSRLEHTRTVFGHNSQMEPNDFACSMCTRTFRRLADRDRHFNTIHSNNGKRPWKCTMLGCPASVQTWASPNGLRKHNKAWHGPYSCDISSCSRRTPNGFSSMAELQQHNIDEHSAQLSGVGSRVSTEEVLAGRSARLASGEDQTSIGKSWNRQSRGYSKVQDSDYPQPWSDWTWDRDNKHWWCRREITFETFEYDYQDENHKPITPTYRSSKYRAASSSTQPSASTEQNQDQYATTPDFISRLSNAVTRTTFEDTSLAPPELSRNHPLPQAHVTTKHPSAGSEVFDRNYQTHMEWEFRWGRVFKILWSEPTGSDAKGGTIISERLGRWGQKFTEKVRRFVIIDNRRGHCICLPIMTYGGQGCLKKGVHAGDHAIIYTTSEPARFAGEDGMTKKPIKVKQYSPQHKLEPASRLNYAKVYTVEYNAKVWFIGEIHKDSEWWLTAAYNEAHPPLKPRGIPPPFPLGSSSTAGYPTSARTDTYFPDQYAQHTTAGSFGGQSAFTSAANSLHSTWSQRESLMHNPGRMQDYPPGRMQDTRAFDHVATSDWRSTPTAQLPRADAYGGSDYAESSSIQLTLTTSRADYPPVDYDDSLYLPQEQSSNRRRFEDDDLYNA